MAEQGDGDSASSRPSSSSARAVHGAGAQARKSSPNEKGGNNAPPPFSKIAAGEYDDALARIECRLEKRPDEIGLLVRTGELLRRKQHHAEAVADLEAVLAQHPGSVAATLAALLGRV